MAIWIIPVLVITVMVGIDPIHRSVTPTYHKAVQNWVEHGSLYGGFDYHYPPHFALLFAPFHFLPAPVGDVLWRLVCAGLLAGGLWRLCQAGGAGKTSIRFFWATVAAVPLLLPALRNGQANALMAGLFLQATVSVIRREWWRAVLWMVVAVAVKQFGIVLPLLAVFMYAPLRWRMVVGGGALAAFPFLCANYAYVIKENIESITHLQACVAVTENRFADVAGITRTFGWELPAAASQLIRALAGGATLAAWWYGGKRVNEPLRGMWLFALAGSYLMLFNPMTEANSYVILAPAMGCWAAWALGDRETRPAGWIILAMALSMGLLPNLVRPVFGNHFALFWHPTMTIVFVGIVGYWIFRPNPAEWSVNAETPGPAAIIPAPVV